MSKRNAIKQSDTLSQGLSLGHGVNITEAPQEFLYLTNFKKNRIYDNSFFIQETLMRSIEITQYTLQNAQPYSFYEEQDSLHSNNEQFKELAKTDDKLQGGREFIVSRLYALLQTKYNVELFKSMTGLFSKTPSYFYIDEIPAVIVHDDMCSEDILNLLSIKDLNVYIYSIQRHFGSEDYSIELYKISLVDEAYPLIVKEASTRQKETESTKKSIKAITPSSPLNTYLSLQDTEDLSEIYESLSKVQKRALQHFLLNTRGNEAVGIVASYETFLKLLSDDIVSVDLLLQSYRNLEMYKKNNLEKLSKDHNMHFNRFLRNHKYVNHFSNYKLLVKDFNSRYKDFHKFMKEWYRIVKEAETTKPTYTHNKDSIYYKVAVELAESLSKLWFISEVRLFGSVAKGLEKEGSDIDIAFKVGIDIKGLTKARRETMYRIVKHEAGKIENKYKELVEAHLDKKYGKNDTFRYVRDKLFDILAIQFQKKKHQKQYEDLNFFENSIVLFQRDSFELNYENTSRKMNFQDIEHVLFPTNRYYSFIINKKEENDDWIGYEYIKFDYQQDEEDEEDETDYTIDYIAYQVINKEEGYWEQKPKMEIAKEFKHKNVFNPLRYLDNEYHLIEDGLSGGIVRINPNVPSIYKYHWDNMNK